MRFLLFALLVAAFLGTTGWFSLATAQGTRTVSSRATAERAAVDLTQGMTSEEVQQLLGKPWRTALTSGGSSGSLRWTYTWGGAASGAERNLNVDFVAKVPQQWTVSGWSWTTY